MGQNDALVRQDERKTSAVFCTCFFILAVEFCERLCYYTVRGSMKTYLYQSGPHDENTDVSIALKLLGMFGALSYLWCILGGYLADSRWGRYKTILYLTPIYILGVWLAAFMGLEKLMVTSWARWLYLVGVLGFICFGTGGIKPNVANFGADQFDENNPKHMEWRSSWFMIFYMSINVGSCLCNFFTVNIATGHITAAGPGSGFFVSYLIAALAMTAGYFIFIAGSSKYQGKEMPGYRPSVSVLVKHILQGSSGKAKVSILGWVSVPIAVITSLADPLLPAGANPDIPGLPGLTAMSMTSAIFTFVSVIALMAAHYNNDWIQPLSTPIARAAFTHEEVRGALRLIPTIMLICIGFGICYNTGDVVLSIACQMDLTLSPGWKSLVVAPEGQFTGNFFGIGNTFTIVILILILESMVYPCLRKRNMMPSRKTGFALGFFFAILMEVVTIIIEIMRKHKADMNQFVECPQFVLDKCNLLNHTDPGCLCAPLVAGDPTWYWLSQCASQVSYVIDGIPVTIQAPMTAMSAWWMVIPQALQGVAEILINPPMYDFVFDECPAPLRSLMQGFQLLANGTLSACMSNFFAFMIPNDFDNESGLQNVIIYFVVTSVCAILNYLLYSSIALPDRKHDEPEALSS